MSLRVVPVGSFVSFQKALYFNGFFSLLFGASLVAQCIYKLTYVMLAQPARIYLPVLTAFWCLIEVLRLRVGSAGNLNESVRGGGGRVPSRTARAWTIAFSARAHARTRSRVQRRSPFHP